MLPARAKTDYTRKTSEIWLRASEKMICGLLWSLPDATEFYKTQLIKCFHMK